MEKQGVLYLRESIRILVRNLGILEKGDATCCGITISQCHAIVEIGRAKQMSLNRLSELLGLNKSTMSRTINNLVEDNLVFREIHTKDRRYINIELTSKGQGVYQDIEMSMGTYYKKIFQSIPEDKRQQVLDSLTFLTNAVKENKY